MAIGFLSKCFAGKMQRKREVSGHLLAHCRGIKAVEHHPHWLCVREGAGDSQYPVNPAISPPDHFPFPTFTFLGSHLAQHTHPYGLSRAFWSRLYRKGLAIWKAVPANGLGASELLPGFLRDAVAGRAATLLLCQPGGGFAAETGKKQLLLVSHPGEQLRHGEEP